MRDERETKQKEQAATTTRPCRMCGAAIPEARAGAFCSDRCQMADLGAWMRGEYVMSRPLEQDDLDDVV